MLDRDKQQRTSLAVFFLNVGDGGNPRSVGTHFEWCVKLETPARPHAVAVVRRGQKTTPGRMPVAAQAARLNGRLEEAPLPQCR